MVGARTTYRVSFAHTLALYPRVRTSATLSAPDQRSLIGGDLRCENTLRYGTRNIAASSARTKIQLNVSKLTIVPIMIIDPANPFWRISSNAGLLNRNSPDCLLRISARRRCLWLIRRRDQDVLRSANIRSSPSAGSARLRRDSDAPPSAFVPAWLGRPLRRGLCPAREVGPVRFSWSFAWLPFGALTCHSSVACE